MTTNCIACGKPLKFEHGSGGWSAYCSYGPCPSDAANEGAVAPTIAGACDALHDLVVEDLAAKDMDIVQHLR